MHEWHNSVITKGTFGIFFQTFQVEGVSIKKSWRKQIGHNLVLIVYVYCTIILYLFYVLLMKNSNTTCQIILLIYLVNEASELRNKNAFPIILFGRMRMTEYTDKASITHLMHIIFCTCSKKHPSLKLN